MSVVRMELWDAAGRLKLATDSYFLYTAYAPMSDDEVLVKVGISTIPYQRLVAIYCNTPFPVELAAFTVMGRKRNALRAERVILEQFAEHKTRGEWLKLKSDQETRQRFATAARKVVEQITGKPVQWQRVSSSQIRAYMSGKMRDKFDA